MVLDTMSTKLLKTLAAVAAFASIAACSSKYEPRESIVAEQAKPIKPLYTPQTELERRAYEEGVTQVLTDLKGKMRARDRFTWDPPMI